MTRVPSRALARAAVAVAALTLVAGACTQSGSVGPSSSSGSPSSGSPSAGAKAPHGIFKLDHLIFIVQENRSFDQYFGTFPGADGIPMTPSGTPKVCVPDPYNGRCDRPFHSTSLFQAGGRHDHYASVVDVNGGKMDGFVRILPPGPDHCWVNQSLPGCDQQLGPQGQPDVMSYHTADEIPNYWTYARKFVLQDHMFAPADSWTLPSHLFLVSGWSAACNGPHRPMSCRSDLNLTDPAHVYRYGEGPVYAWTDITYLLSKADVSWSYFVSDGTCLPTAPTCKGSGRGGTSPGKNPLPGFTDVRETHQLGNIHTHADFFEQAAAGKLPSVSWVVPGSPESEHPGTGYSLARGQAYVTRLINAAMQGPDWGSTAVFLTWDDWGGFYDHVPPTRVDQNGYGIRVPGLLISPYAKRGYIDHQTLTFDAYLKLIEDRFLGGQRLDPKTDGRPDSRPTVREDLPKLGDLRREFDFSQQPRRPTVLDPRP